MIKSLFTFPKLLVFFVLVATLGIRLYNLNYNTPFFDEAIYINIGISFFTGKFDDASPFYWVGGMPFFYPPLTAMASVFGGVIGSRVLNVIFGSLSIYFMYRLTSNLRFFHTNTRLNDLTGIFAALLLAVESTHITVSRLAVYDMPAFALFLAGIVFLQKAAYREKRNHYLWAVCFFTLAFLAKYTVAMFFPLIVILLLVYTVKYNRQQLDEVVFFIGALSLVSIVYLIRYFEELLTFLGAQVVNRGTLSSIDILTQYAEASYIWLIAAILGLLVLLFMKRFQYALLFLFALFPPFIQAATHDSATIEKNALYTIVFLIPFAAFIFGLLSKLLPLFGTVLCVGTAIMLFLYTTPQRLQTENSWPNSKDAVIYLSENIAPKDKILAEKSDVIAYALYAKLPYKYIVGPYNFSYNARKGMPAYEKAIEDTYFTYIYLDGELDPFQMQVEQSISKKYKLVYQEGSIKIYKRI